MLAWDSTTNDFVFKDPATTGFYRTAEVGTYDDINDATVDASEVQKVSVRCSPFNPRQKYGHATWHMQVRQAGQPALLIIRNNIDGNPTTFTIQHKFRGDAYDSTERLSTANAEHNGKNLNFADAYKTEMYTTSGDSQFALTAGTTQTIDLHWDWFGDKLNISYQMDFTFTGAPAELHGRIEVECTGTAQITEITPSWNFGDGSTIHNWIKLIHHDNGE